MERYGIIPHKRPREIVLLRGSGCVYRRCTFCDYYRDECADTAANFALNRAVLDRVQGLYGELEVINSGSVFELDEQTLAYVRAVCRQKRIGVIHFESHDLYRGRIAQLRRAFAPFTLKMKLGLETFDDDLRENVLRKGIAETDPARISESFDEANFLFGICGQTASSMQRDVTLGLRYFERICINLFCPNSTTVQPDERVIDTFRTQIYPALADDPRVDVLWRNTDFGVGA